MSAQASVIYWPVCSNLQFMSKNVPFDFLFGHSDVGKMASQIDWSNHDMGDVDTWSQSFRTSLSIVLNSKFPMFISWGKNRWFFYNDAYAVILGNKHPAAFGKRFIDVWPEIWSDIAPLIQSVDAGQSVYIEDMKLIMNRTGQDEETYFTFSYSPVRSESNEVQGLFCAVVETTEKIFAIKESRDAIKLRDEFLSIASHELKTPLTALKLQSQVFKKIMTNTSLYSFEKVKEFSSHVDKQTFRLGRLIDDMLDIARMRTGKLTIAKQRVNLCSLVTDVVQRMEAQFTASGYSVPDFEECEDIYGEWDIHRLEQVIANILTNAIRYGEGKTITISVTARPESALLAVKDLGIGIPHDQLENVFQIFTRVSHLKDVSGMGLGLFLTRQIVDAHKGKIWAESTLGEGATFYIELPLTV